MNSHYGITYDTTPGDYGVIRVRCYHEGTLLPRHYIGPLDMRRKSPYHLVRSEEVIPGLCRRLYWSRIREDSDPLGDLQQRVRARTEDKALRLYQEARHTGWKIRERKRAARAYGKAREQVKPSDVEALRWADPGTIGV